MTIGLVDTVDRPVKDQAIERALFRVEEPVVRHAGFGVPAALGLAVVRLVAFADRFDDERRRDQDAPVLKVAPASALSMGTLLFDLILGGKPNGIHDRYTSSSQNQVHFRRESTA